MTRGKKGCYIYCTDPETNAYFKNLLQNQSAQPEIKTETTCTVQDLNQSRQNHSYPGLTLAILKQEKVEPYVNSVPLYDLQIAAGSFSDTQNVEDYDWVTLPDLITRSKNYISMFTEAKVVNI